MGSTIELNDTLQLTAEQGFPAELNYEQHVQQPFTTQQFAGRIFTFTNKPGIRVYHIPPVRNFLAENRDGKWLYWGLINMIELTHNYEQQTTSGTFTIVSLYSPETMREIHQHIDGRTETDFFHH